MCSRLKGMLNKKKVLAVYKNLFYRANRIWTSGPAFARSFQILTNACAFYCDKKSTVLKTVDSEKLFIGQTGFEPATSTSRTSRATSCAIARKKNVRNCSVAGCDLNVPNLKIEEPLRKIAKTWSNFLGSTYRQRATSCASFRRKLERTACCPDNCP